MVGCRPEVEGKMKRELRIVNKQILAQPLQGTCLICAEDRLLTDSAWITDGFKMRKLYVCEDCGKRLEGQKPFF